MNSVLPIVTFILQYGLPAFQQIVGILYQDTMPTKAQWDAVFALANKSYDDYVRGQVPDVPMPT